MISTLQDNLTSLAGLLTEKLFNAISGVLSVVLPVAVKPAGVSHINDFAVEMQKALSEFYCFGTVHAGMENIEAETERLLNMGLHGIKLHPDTQLFDIVRRAEKWLQENTYDTRILKWKTEEWGEIPADFGRK